MVMRNIILPKSTMLRSMYLSSRAKVQAKGSLNQVLEVVSRTEASLDRILSTCVPSHADANVTIDRNG